MTATEKPTKPLGMKAYGSIPHLPGSRMGPADHHCHEGQARIATVKARDKHDTIIVQEKLDGSCVAIAKLNGELVALTRAGYRATDSPYEQHHLFDEWVQRYGDLFRERLNEGERVVGEWLAQAHGTRYLHTEYLELFVWFDLFRDGQRLTTLEAATQLGMHYAMAQTFHMGEPLSIDEAMRHVGFEVAENGCYGWHGAQDPVEGCVWRVERDGTVDFIVKYVRPDKVDGCYLESVTGNPPVWNKP